jgi:hypothetical protein
MSKRDAERNYFELKYLGFQENQPEEKAAQGQSRDILFTA